MLFSFASTLKPIIINDYCDQAEPVAWPTLRKINFFKSRSYGFDLSESLWFCLETSRRCEYIGTPI